MEREVTISITSPCDCTEEQFQAWIEYCVGYSGEVSMDNPLHEYDMEANSVTI